MTNMEGIVGSSGMTATGAAPRVGLAYSPGDPAKQELRPYSRATPGVGRRAFIALGERL